MKTQDIKNILGKANLSEAEINSLFSALEDKFDMTEDTLTEQINTMIPESLSKYEGVVISVLPKLNETPTATATEKEIAEKLGIDETIVAKITKYGEATIEKADSIVDSVNKIPLLGNIPIDVSQMTDGYSSREEIGDSLNSFLAEQERTSTSTKKSELTPEQIEELKNKMREFLGNVKDFFGDKVEDLKNGVKDITDRLSDFKDKIFPDKEKEETEHADKSTKPNWEFKSVLSEYLEQKRTEESEKESARESAIEKAFFEYKTSRTPNFTSLFDNEKDDKEPEKGIVEKVKDGFEKVGDFIENEVEKAKEQIENLKEFGEDAKAAYNLITEHDSKDNVSILADLKEFCEDAKAAHDLIMPDNEKEDSFINLELD